MSPDHANSQATPDYTHTHIHTHTHTHTHTHAHRHTHTHACTHTHTHRYANRLAYALQHMRIIVLSILLMVSLIQDEGVTVVIY